MSVELLEAYGAQVDRLAGVATQVALAEYDRVEPDESGELQRSFVIFLARTADNLEALHAIALEQAAGYIAAAGAEAGAPVAATAPRSLEDEDPFGRPIGELLGPVASKVYLALSQGMTLDEALEVGRHATSSIAESFVRDASRSALSSSFERSDAIVGFRWVSRGTCGACMGADTGEDLPPGFSLNVHPNCQCIAEPVFEGPTFPDRLLSRREAEATLEDWRDGWIEPEINGVPILPNTYSAVNRAARGASATPQELANLDAGLTFELPEEVVAYRGIEPEFLGELRVGDTIIDSGYPFVSLMQDWAQGFAGSGRPVVRMVLPAGERVFLGKVFEAEMVLSRGSRFRVVRVGRVYIDVEIVRPR